MKTKNTTIRTSRAWLLLPLGDAVLVVGIFLLGFWLRHYILSDFLNSIVGTTADFRLSASHYLMSGVVMGAIEVFMLSAFGVYRKEFGLAHIEELAWILRSSFMAVVITFAFSFVTRQLFVSRFVLVFAFPSTAVVLSLWHYTFHRIARNSARKSGKQIRVVMYGSGELAHELAEFMEKKASIPYCVSGFVRSEGTGENDEMESCSLPPPPRGSEGLFEWLSANNVSELIIADPSISREERADLIYRCEQEGISYKLVADVFTLVSLTTRVVHMGGTTMIESVPPPLSGSKKILKRVLDVGLTALITVVFLPLMLITAAAIVITSGFPILYVQTRLGADNRPFRMIKFRSMRQDAHAEKENLTDRNESTGPLFKIRNDPRITPVGRLIRKWSIDELPQLMNVLTGRMSLVGPRPPLPEEVREYSEKHMKRLQTIPGITGVWQVSGRSSLGFEEMVKLDLYYVDNWSVWMDIAILLLTPVAIFSRRGAY
jgi:exopolysaccharide biosynthesis polyprenyl glycosylphosphotransferase